MVDSLCLLKTEDNIVCYKWESVSVCGNVAETLERRPVDSRVEACFLL